MNEDSAHRLITQARYAEADLPPLRETTAGRLAWALSVVLHPLLLPTLLFALLFWLSPSMMGVAGSGVRYRILLLLAVSTFVIPMLSTYMLYRLGSIRSLAMEDRQDRVFPFVSTALFYLLTTYMFAKHLSALYLITLVLGGVTASLLAVTVVSFFWKISAHSVGISGVAGFLMGFYYHYAAVEYLYPTLAVIVLGGFLMSARLYLNAHTPSQVLAGALLGLAVGMGTVFLFA